MKLTFLGAAREVTGSMFLLSAAGKNIVVDCGMQQGQDIYENQEMRISAADVDAVFLTHAHIDHSGKLPMLYKQGFKGEIFTTVATADLAEIMLLDSAHIQESETEWKNKKAKRKNEPLVEPLYSVQDAMDTLKLFHPIQYGKNINIGENIVARFVDAGHLLGSAHIEMWITEEGKTTKLIFSGDIGNTNQPIIKDPTYPDEADFVIMESTYGDRDHGAHDDAIEVLTDIIRTTFKRGGDVIIPAFAVGRTQEMLYFIRQIIEENRLKDMPPFTVYMDSPMAIQSTTVFTKNQYSCFDEATMEVIRRNVNPISFRQLKTSVTADESKAINFDEERKIIISASGMCEAGRIKHHLKHGLWKKENTVLFVGYQAVGTLGRSLVDGAKSVKIFGEKISVNAEVRTLIGVSGHADRNGLLKWAKGIKGVKRFFIVHGDEPSALAFEELLNNNGMNTYVPYPSDCWDLDKDIICAEGPRTKVQKKAAAAGAAGKGVSSVFGRLLDAIRKLSNVADTYKHGANKDVTAFADDVFDIANKWDNM